jgi:hypothetical protein
MSDTDTVKLGGAKRKNGHKSNCTCHICENMVAKAKRGGYKEDLEKEREKKMGGSKKKNGHKKDCDCPICKNMKNKKNDVSDKNKSTDKKSCDGKKKSNGHKMDCGCPICKNMKKKKGGADEMMEESVEINEPVTTKAEDDAKDKEVVIKDKPDVAKDDEYDEIENIPETTVGGTKKNRGSKRSNGHKKNCGCPICKNMKKTRRNKKRGTRRR